MRRAATLAVTVLLVLAACTGGDEDEDGAALPLPSEAPSAAGPATGPGLEAKVLLSSTDELEGQLGEVGSAQVERRSDAFISGRTVVGYSVDDISGYDLDSGEQLWTAKLDLGGGTVCFVSQPDRAVKHFTVAYGESGSCPSLATIRVSDGKVVNISERLSDLPEFEGEPAGGAVRHLFTVEGEDHLVDFRGVVWRMAEGEPEAIARLEADSYFDLVPTPDGEMLVGSRLSDGDRCRVDGYTLPSFENAWTQDGATLFPDVDDPSCVIAAAEGDPSWLMQETTDSYTMVQVDPATGEVLGSEEAPKDSGGQAAEGEFDLASAANQFDRTLGMSNGDMVFAQVNGLTRLSLESGEVAWDLDLSQLELESQEEFPLTDVLPQGVTADGYLVASVSNNTAAEIVAVDAESGELAARWPVPEEFGNGFQVQPGMTLFDGGVVLTRNFEQWEFTFASYREGLVQPEGDQYDIGVFTFPEPDDSPDEGVSTAGPGDDEAVPFGGLETPDDTEREAGSFNTGSGVVVGYAGSTVTGLDASSGEQVWSREVGPDPSARVCSPARPEQAVKTVTLSYRTADGEKCSNLVRLAVADGEVVDQVEVPEELTSVTRLVMFERTVLILTEGGGVHRIEDGRLVEHAELARGPYSLETAAQDPSLLVATSSVEGGKDWAIDAYRLPELEPVWSTKGSEVFSDIDPDNQVVGWRDNGLWVSTTFGDISDPEATTQDALAQLDPADGSVVAETGKVEKDYLADDLETFSLTAAATGYFRTTAFEDGDVVLPQSNGAVRYSLEDEEIRWSLDLESIMGSMEQDRGSGLRADQSFDLVDGGETVLVTLSNGTSVELITVEASTGSITGRWTVPASHRNGLQAGTQVTTFGGGVALAREDYSFDYAFEAQGREVPSETQYDVGLFRLPGRGGD
ncbi:PQQ-binding-like beta-propeller repeat protein [Aeromicrobium sp. CF4.19]|uniref:outer membrane protein assembly factor BamB family protein n=1 Tax=Aeromicrobium sp. CF4.19 TaxID=3373082 RepID=UPI003EE7D0D1